MVTRPEPAMEEVGDGLGARVVAFGLDAVVVGVVWAVAWMAGTSVRGTIDGPGATLLSGGVSLAGGAVWLVTWVVVVAVAGAYFAVGHAVAGQSVGKRLADVVVATRDGGPCGWRPALVRTAVLLAPAPLVAALDLLLGLAGAFAGAGLVAAWLVVELAVAALDDEGRRLGDRVAGTVVVPESLATV